MHSKVIPQRRDGVTSARQALYVTGSSFSNKRCKSGVQYSKTHGSNGDLVKRSVSFINDGRRSNGSNECIEAEKVKHRVLNGKADDSPRACKSASVSTSASYVSSLSKRTELKRSKSDAALKLSSRLYNSSKINNVIHEDVRRLSSALKRKESFTRWDIISDQCEKAVTKVQQLSKFKLHVKVGVKSDHYNQWARSKRSAVSTSLSSPYLVRSERNSKTPPLYSSRRHDVPQCSSFAIPTKVNSTNNTCSTNILNFANFSTIINDLPAGKPRIQNKRMSIGCTHSASNVKRTDDCNGLKVERDMLHIDGDDALNSKEDLHQENKYIHVPRISIGNGNECITPDIEPGKINLVSQEKSTGDSRNIEAICEANSFNLEIPNNYNTSTSSDGEFDRSPVTDGIHTNGNPDICERGVIVSKSRTESDECKDMTRTKTALIPIKQDILSSFEVKVDNPLRIIIKDNFYRISKVQENLKETKQCISNAIKENVSDSQDSVITLEKDKKSPTKIPLKISTKSPVLNTENLENTFNFAQMRIEQHLRNLKLRTEFKLNSPRNSSVLNNPRNSSVKIAKRDDRVRSENNNRYKQNRISINEQAGLELVQTLGQ